MTIPLAGGQPTLDLYGRPAPALHRPRLAAAGCWLLAASFLVPLAMTVIYRIIALRGFSPLWSYNHNVYIVDDASTYGLLAGGALLLCFADLGRGAMSPWPRRLMAACEVAACVPFLAFDCVIKFFPMTFAPMFATRGPGSVYFWLTAFQALRLFAQLAAYYFGLLYALQIARWLGNRPLTTASMRIFAVAIPLETAAGSLGLWVNYRLFSHPPRMPPANMRLVLTISGWLSLAISLAWVIYFVLLAVRLGRSSRRS